MKVVTKLILGMGLFTCMSVAVAAPPPAPTLTVAATDIKQLQFDITPVPTVGSYELWFRALPGAEWVKYTETPAQRPIIRIGASVHLLDWPQARYFVKACNPSGCTPSNEVGVGGEQFAAMGYFKPPTSPPYQYFGFNFAVSADGTTMVVLAAERIGGKSGSAAIHVYRKTTSTSRWRHEARLVPSTNTSGSGASVAGDPLSISIDGKVIAFGSWMENTTTGAVYLFRRDWDGWHETQKITSNNSPRDHFGINVKLDVSGQTLVIGHDLVGEEPRPGTLEVYKDRYDNSDQFLYASTVPAPVFADRAVGYCRGFAVSSAMQIVRSCYDGTGPSTFFTQVLTETSWAPLHYTETARLPVGTGGDVDIDIMGERLLVQQYSAGVNSVLMYRREASGWVKDGTLNAFPGQISHAAISGDGNIVAIGSTDDTLAGRGPVFPPYQQGSDRTGTVAVYERRVSGWRLRRFVKADTGNALHSFGWEVALDRNGHVLAVGSPYDASKATGIDGDREDASIPDRGAVWLY